MNPASWPPIAAGSSFTHLLGVNLSSNVQGGPSGCTLHNVDIKPQVLSQYSLLIQKHNSEIDVKKR